QDYTYQYGADGHLSITGYIGLEEEIIIPSMIEGKSVTSIANEAFKNNGRMVRVVIPEGVNHIGKSAFQSAYNLVDIQLPQSLRFIEESAFNSCFKLKAIILPQGITTVSSLSFLRCMDLKTVYLPDSLRSIEDYAFAITGLESIDFPEGIETIGKHAFYGNSNLKEITFPNSVKRIEDYAFFVCESLTQIVLPTSLQAMASGVFDKCPQLEKIAIPKAVTNIRDDSLFSGVIKPLKLKILGVPNSEAERFAIRTGLPFEALALSNHVDMKINGEEVTNKLYAIDLSSGITTLNLQASSQPESLWTGVLWSSSLPAVATVNSDGQVNVLKKGEVTISATAADGGGAQANINLSIASLAKKITISGNSFLFSKSKQTFKATILPATADNKNIEWTVSDSSIITVNNNGVVTASEVSQKRSAKVLASAKDGSGVSHSFEITVYPLVKEVGLLHNNLIVKPKETLTIDLASNTNTLQLMVRNYPVDALQQMFWKSSSAKIATVSEDGLVTGLRSGNARISATTSDGTKKTITFTVKVAELIKEISISGSVMIAAEQKQNLQADILPESASNRKLEWTSSDDSIVRVNKNNGQITARKTDSIKQVTISAKALDGSDISSDFVLSIHPLATNVIISQDGFILEKKAKLN
ncbi:MAG: leucine-rich repeat protein, partial [Bacteroidales bacterium]|nr:leucine-rich repeat protein [Bacteroidales bacterium]